MTLLRRSLSTLLLAGLVFTPAARAGGLLQSLLKGSDKPLVLDASTDLPATVKLAFQKPSSLDEVRGTPPARLAVSAFQIRFVTDSGFTSRRGNASSSVDYQLEVPPLELFQRVADTMRGQLEAALKQRGYTLLPADALLADAEFARGVAETPKAVEQGPSLLTRNGTIEVNATGGADTFGVMQGAAEMKLAERLGGDVALVKVQLKLDFASLQEMGLVEAAGGSGVKSQVGLSLFSEGQGFSSNGVTVVTPAGAVPNSLMKPVYLTQPIAKSVEKMAQSTSQAVTGFLSSLAGGQAGANRYKVVPADDYEAQLVGAGGQIARLLAATFPARP